MSFGKNTVASAELLALVERIERIAERKADCSADEKVVYAEAKANGFSTATLRLVVKRRKARPADLEEAEALLDLYEHALGRPGDLPLFRTVGLMDVDINARESVIEALKQLVPANGDIIVNAGGKPVKLVRDKDGNVTVSDWTPPVAPAARASGAAAAPVREFPDCSEAEAQALGAQAYRDNKPVISNPFPPGDKRRAAFDLGWRRASGGDGFGGE